MDLAMKLTNAKGQLKLALDTPSFTTTLRWRKADNFQSTKRDWESFGLLLALQGFSGS